MGIPIVILFVCLLHHLGMEQPFLWIMISVHGMICYSIENDNSIASNTFSFISSLFTFSLYPMTFPFQFLTFFSLHFLRSLSIYIRTLLSLSNVSLYFRTPLLLSTFSSFLSYFLMLFSHFIDFNFSTFSIYFLNFNVLSLLQALSSFSLQLMTPLYHSIVVHSGINQSIEQ